MRGELDLAGEFIAKSVESITRLYAYEEIHQGSYPVIVYFLSRGGQVMGSGGKRFFANPVYGVKSITQGEDTTPGDTFQMQIDAALNARRNVPVGNGSNIVTCFNVGWIRYSTNENNTVYRHRGALYEMKVRKGGADAI